MGGKAFKNINIVKLNKEEFEYHSKIIINRLRDILNSEDVNILPYYKNKSSFGDIDIMVTKEDIHQYENNNMVNIMDGIKKELDLKEYSEQGDIFSGAYPIGNNKFIQIDFMPHNKKDYKNVLKYFSYNDLPILISRFIATPIFGVHYTHEGCEINIYREKNSTEYLLGIAKTENSIDKFLSMLDLDPKRLNKGFNELEDIYNYVCNSCYFDYSSFKNQIDISNYAEKNRLKRKVYTEFIDFVEDNMKHKIGKKPNNILFETFPELLRQKKEMIFEYERYKKFKTKFNGENIAKVLNLNMKDKHLGIVIKSFLVNRSQSKNIDFINKVNNMNNNDFNDMINERYKEIKNEDINIKPKKRIF